MIKFYFINIYFIFYEQGAEPFSVFNTGKVLIEFSCT